MFTNSEVAGASGRPHTAGKRVGDAIGRKEIQSDLGFRIILVAVIRDRLKASRGRSRETVGRSIINLSKWSW